jgi:hypothetical protein
MIRLGLGRLARHRGYVEFRAEEKRMLTRRGEGEIAEEEGTMKLAHC